MKLENIGFYTLEDVRAKNLSLTSPLWRCELLLNDSCNFNCPYCRGDRKSGYYLSSIEALNVVDLWSNEGLKNIRFSGGEPTLWESLPNLIEYTKGKGIQRIAISTNGSANLKYYKHLIRCGVNDISISLDACCAADGAAMSNTDKNMFGKVVNNIRELSKLTYVTVGAVLTEYNMPNIHNIIKYAHNLGVSDIRIIPAAQWKKGFDRVMFMLSDDILNKHPILYYRIVNCIEGKSIRGIQKTDNHKCPLILDDMAIKGEYHYPCIIKLRENCKPIGKVSKYMRQERYEYYKKTDVYNDSICRNNCLDVCVEYNNKVRQINDNGIR